MFLATTALMEFWDTSDKILALGPWCLRYDQKEKWEGFQCTMAPNPWENPKAVEEAAEYCGKIIDSLIAELAVRLNRIHGVNRTERYWRILLWPWLLYYVHALYDRYVSLKQVIESHKELRSIVLSPTDYRTPLDTRDFLDLAIVDSPDLFNLQLYSQILKSLNVRTVVLEELNPILNKQDKVSADRKFIGAIWRPKPLVKRMARRACTLLALIVAPKVMLGGLGLNRRNRLRLMLAMSSRGWALPAPLVSRCMVPGRDESMRKDISDLPARDEFTAVLSGTMATNFPLIYLEGYKAFREACLAAWPSPPAILFSFDGWVTHESFKLLAAENSERGSRLVGGQHGEGYGVSKVIPQEEYELAITDRWFSYGWRDDERAEKIRPLPNPMFKPIGTFNSRRNQRVNDILLVASNSPIYPHKFESWPTGRFESHLEWRHRFVQGLTPALRARLVVRMHVQDCGWFQEQRLIERFGPLRFDDQILSLRRRLGQYRLVVSEYRGTALLEILAANVPAIFFWDPGYWMVRSEAMPYFENLEMAGVLWKSPERAAAKVAGVYDDPWRWWNGKTVQEARQAFVNRYALGRHDWLDWWIKALEEEIALSRVGAGRDEKHSW